VHEFVNHTQKDMRAVTCMRSEPSVCSPDSRLSAGVSWHQYNEPARSVALFMPADVRQRHAFEQAECILQAALDPRLHAERDKGSLSVC